MVKNKATGVSGGLTVSCIAATVSTVFALGVAVTHEPVLREPACLGTALSVLMCGIAIGYAMGRMRDCAEGSEDNVLRTGHRSYEAGIWDSSKSTRSGAGRLRRRVCASAQKEKR